MKRYEEAKSICRLFHQAGHPTMMAGGCVRDHLMGRAPKDYDLATTALPHETMALIKDLGYKCVPTGLQHGTVSLISALQTLEITTLRSDDVCDGRHADVSFSSDFAVDAARRDFTINALFEDHLGEVHDFVGGVTDIRQKRLRFVGEPEARIREDYLRALRYFRFLGRYGWEPQPEAMGAVQACLHGMDKLSFERIIQEMDQVLMDQPQTTLPLMWHVGLLTALFPHLQQDESLFQQSIAAMSAVPDVHLRWFTFLYWNGPQDQSFEAFIKRKPYSRKQRRLWGRLARLMKPESTPRTRALALLDLLDADDCEPAMLKDLLSASHRAQLVPPPDALSTLIDGFQRQEPPVIPREDLMAVNPPNRGDLVKDIKIAWYSGLCRDKQDISRLIHHPHERQSKLQNALGQL